MAQRMLRVVYAIEFLMTLVATLALWREAGGQGHLDLMPWYWKFFLPIGLSASIVKLTAASAEIEKRPKRIWFAVTMLAVIFAGLLTYYYHLNEPLDEEDENTTLTARADARTRY